MKINKSSLVACGSRPGTPDYPVVRCCASVAWARSRSRSWCARTTTHS